MLTLALVLLAGLATQVAQAAPTAPWHLSGWSERATVTIPTPLEASDVDTCAVRVLVAGRARPDGADFRVLDASGASLPFQLTYFDPAQYAWVAFRARDVRQTYYVYFGNPAAERAAEQVAVDDTPGAGPPIGDWVPRHGLVYATRQRPRAPANADGSLAGDDNPKTVEELAHMLRASPALQGARYQRGIADGFNPFGSSDYYLSVYRGWINIKEAGTYRFCTASNEASFSFLDGKELIHWPGRHTADRGIHGEKNASVELTAGVHYIEYYHEEVLLQQMAFLGWSIPGARPDEFTGIPEEVFTVPHAGQVTAHESPQGPSLFLEADVVDSIWPESRHEGQYTRCRFAVPATAQIPQARYTWDFGDGQMAEGESVDHVYLAVGKYSVTVRESIGMQTAAVPFDVYEIQHVTHEVAEGKPTEYAAICAAYDRSRLDALALKELAWLQSDADNPTLALEATREFMAKYAADHGDWLPPIRRLMAECLIRLDEGSIDEAVANYLGSLTESTPTVERFEVYTRLVRLLGLERDLPDRAHALFAQAQTEFKTLRADAETRDAYRKCMIADADVLLWHADRENARLAYQRAEAMADKPIPDQVRKAKLGSYPDSIRDYISTEDLGAALDLVEVWRNLFPLDQISGQPWFWRGKLLALRAQHDQAARFLARAAVLGTGAGFESEARYLLAHSLLALGKKVESRRELARLVQAGFQDDFGQRAREELLALRDEDDAEREEPTENPKK